MFRIFLGDSLIIDDAAAAAATAASADDDGDVTNMMQQQNEIIKRIWNIIGENFYLNHIVDFKFHKMFPRSEPSPFIKEQLTN